MRLICSHMKDSLIESESRFHCLGVSTLTPDSHSALWTTQGLMEAGTLTNTYVNTLAHNVFLRGKCANITSGAFTTEARENETKACSSKIPACVSANAHFADENPASQTLHACKRSFAVPSLAVKFIS